MTFRMHTNPGVDLNVSLDILNYSGDTPPVFVTEVINFQGTVIFKAQSEQFTIPGQFVLTPSAIVIRFVGHGIQAAANDTAIATFGQAGGDPSIDPPGRGNSVSEAMDFDLKTFSIGVVP